MCYLCFLFEVIASLLFWILCCTVSHRGIKTERQLLFSTYVQICLLNIVLLHFYYHTLLLDYVKVLIQIHPT